MQPLQLIFPLKFAMAAGGLCCAGTLGVSLQASENHVPDDPVASPIAHPIRTIRVVPDEPPAKPAIISPVPFEERWQIPTQSASLRPVPATTEPPAQAPKIIRIARAEPSDDPVCGDKGRRYFYIDRHKYWKCRR
ncbi:hypothetical protein [Bradyrhizobium sp. RT3a]|uniref:hypothetical protein n=1 Tax=Bradyrhizobium sp. RT3a TaxID=3156333 RepID=UPI0033910F23